MRVSIQKWGNSLAVRIPKPVAVESKLGHGSVVDLSLLRGRVVLKPVTGKKYTLEQLLAGVKKENLHEEVDTGKPVGRELW
jgi:antitoxin MazE